MIGTGCVVTRNPWIGNGIEPLPPFRVKSPRLLNKHGSRADFARQPSRDLTCRLFGNQSLLGRLGANAWRQTKALSPVMDLPTINVFISLVPS